MFYVLIGIAILTWSAVFILEFRSAKKKQAALKAAEAAKATEETPTEITPEN